MPFGNLLFGAGRSSLTRTQKRETTSPYDFSLSEMDRIFGVEPTDDPFDLREMDRIFGIGQEDWRSTPASEEIQSIQPPKAWPTAPVPPPDYRTAMGELYAPEASIGDRAKDLMVGLSKGSIGLGDAALGLSELAALAGDKATSALGLDKYRFLGPTADPATAGQRPSMTKLAKKYLGWNGKQWQDWLDTHYSPEQQAEFGAVERAEGFTGTLGALARNPSVAIQNIVESAPAMVAGAYTGGATGLGAVAGGAYGEALISGGQKLAELAGEDGLTPREALFGVASGVWTAVVNRGMGKLADKFGYADINTLLAKATTNSKVRDAVESLTKRAAKIPASFAGEATEEVLQTWGEVAATNLSNGRPWNEGIGKASAQASVAGGFMGAGAQAYTSFRERGAPPPPPPPAGEAVGTTGEVAPPPPPAIGAPPPPAPGMVRMYHGGVQDTGPGSRFFTSDIAYAQNYAEKSGGTVSYVDIPADHPSVAPLYPEQGIAQGFHQMAQLPAEIAEQRQPLAPVAPAPPVAQPVAPPAIAPEQEQPGLFEAPPVVPPELGPAAVAGPPVVPPLAAGPPSPDAVIDRITTAQAEGRPLGTPEAQAAFAERQRVEAERAAAASPEAELAQKSALQERIEELHAELGHPYGDRDDFSAFIQTAPEDLSLFDLQSTLRDLENLQARRTGGPPAGEAATVTPITARPLPRALAAAKPRYGLGDRNFELQFADPVDQALYIVAAQNKSKAHDQYLAYLKDTLGLSGAEAQAAGMKVREQIKAQARSAAPDATSLTIPATTHGRPAARALNETNLPDRGPGRLAPATGRADQGAVVEGREGQPQAAARQGRLAQVAEALGLTHFFRGVTITPTERGLAFQQGGGIVHAVVVPFASMPSTLTPQGWTSFRTEVETKEANARKANNEAEAHRVTHYVVGTDTFPIPATHDEFAALPPAHKAELQRRFHTAGFYDPRTDTITISDRWFDNAEYGPGVWAEEYFHAGVARMTPEEKAAAGVETEEQEEATFREMVADVAKGQRPLRIDPEIYGREVYAGGERYAVREKAPPKEKKPVLPRNLRAPFTRIGEMLTLSSRVPKGPEATARTEVLHAKLEVLSELDDERRQAYGKYAYNLPVLTKADKKELKGKKPEVIIERAVERMVENLRFYWNLMSPKLRERARQWYRGANRIAKALAAEHGVSERQAAGVLASLSPQMDWFKNVDLGRRAISLHKQLTDANPVFDAKLFNVYDKDTRAKALINRKKNEVAYAKKLANRKPNEVVKVFDGETYLAKKHALLDKQRAKYVGKKWSQLNDAGRAVMIRWVDQTTNTRTYPVITPEGETGDLVRNKVTDAQARKGEIGTPSRVGWGSYKAIANAMSILRNGSDENIDRRVGDEHKVRSFFNNIMDPDSPHFVTIDTHAIAAAFNLPLSGADKLVGAVLGGSPSAKAAGLSGTNIILAEAYFRLAKELGILPREVQSVTWEAVRGVFKPEQKRGDLGKALRKQINALSAKYASGTISRDEYEREVLAAAGGFRPPDWGTAGTRGTADEGGVPAPDVLGGRGAGVSAGRGDRLGDTGLARREAAGRPQRDVRGRGVTGKRFAVREDPQTQTPAFQKWFGDSKVVDVDGQPQVVYHGTTADFSKFNRQRGNVESDFGAGFYFSNNPSDISANYAGLGPDLKSKIEREMERLEAEAESRDDLRASVESRLAARGDLRAIAHERLGVEHGGATMPVYLSIQNPAQLGGDSPTRLTMETEYESLDSFDDDEIAELRDQGMDDDEIRRELSDRNHYPPDETGTLPDFIEALRAEARKYDDGNVEPAIARIMDEANYEDIDLAKAIDILKKEEEFVYYTDRDTGNLASNEIIRGALERAGFDGIIDHTVDVKFGSQKRIGRQMAGMDPFTIHYIAFKPNQIKSSTGNRGTFSKRSEDIRYAVREEKPVFYSRLQRAVEETPMQSAFGFKWKGVIGKWAKAKPTPTLGRSWKEGISEEEFAYAQISDLEDGKRYSKQEVLDYLKANDLEVEPVMLGGWEASRTDAEQENVNIEVENAIAAIDEKGFNVGTDGTPYTLYFLDDDFNQITIADVGDGPLESHIIRQYEIPPAVVTNWNFIAAESEGGQNQSARFGQYVEPGGDEDTYREVFLTMPPPKRGAFDPSKLEIKPSEDPDDDHVYLMYDGKVLAVRRRSGRSDDALANLAPQLFTQQKLDAPRAKWSDGHPDYGEIKNPIVRLRYNVRTQGGEPDWRGIISGGEQTMFLEEVQPPSKEQQEKMPPLLQKNWRELALKWALRHAAENGYDRVAWTTGQMQIDRYPSVEKVVDQITWHVNKTNLKTVFFYPKNRDRISAHLDEKGIVKSGTVPPQWLGKPLEEIIGKDLTTRIMGTDLGKAEGEDLKIGGKGLRRVYDVDLKNVANNLPALKKHGVKVGTTEVSIPSKFGDVVWVDIPRRAAANRIDASGTSTVGVRWEDGNTTSVHDVLEDLTRNTPTRAERDRWLGMRQENGETIVKALVDQGLEIDGWIATERAPTKQVEVPAIEVTEPVRDYVMGGQARFAVREDTGEKPITLAQLQKEATEKDQSLKDAVAEARAAGREIDVSEYFNFKRVSLSDDELQRLKDNVIDTVVATGRVPKERMSHAQIREEAQDLHPDLVNSLEEFTQMQAPFRAIRDAARHRINILLKEIYEGRRQLEKDKLEGLDSAQANQREKDLAQMEQDVQALTSTWMRIRSEDGRNLAMHAMMADSMEGRWNDKLYWLSRARRIMGLPSGTDLPGDLHARLMDILERGAAATKRRMEAEAPVEGPELPPAERRGPMSRRPPVEGPVLPPVESRGPMTRGAPVQGPVLPPVESRGPMTRPAAAEGEVVEGEQPSLFGGAPSQQQAGPAGRERPFRLTPPYSPKVTPAPVLGPPLSYPEGKKKKEKLSKEEREAQLELGDFMREMSRTDWWDAINLFRKASLLYGPKTHFRNLGGSMAFQGMEELSNLPASIIDMILSLATGKRTVQGVNPLAMFRASREAATKGRKEALEILKHGKIAEQDMMKYGATREMNTGIKWLDTYTNTSFRLLSAEDALMKSYAYRRSMEAQAAMIAKATNQTVIEVLAQPTEAMAERANADAMFATFNNPNVLGKGWQSFLRSLKGQQGVLALPGKAAAAGLDFLVPFTNTPANVVARMLDYTPVNMVIKGGLAAKRGLFPSTTTDAEQKAKLTPEPGVTGPKTPGAPLAVVPPGPHAAGPTTAAQQMRAHEAQAKANEKAAKELIEKAMTPSQQEIFSRAMGRGMVGSALVYLGWSLAAAGLASGGSDDDEGRRNVKEAQGETPGSIRFGDTWTQVSSFSPMGTLITLGASLYERKHEKLRDEAKRAGKVAALGTRLILEQPMMKGMSDLFETLRNPEQGEHIISQSVGSFIPALANDAAALFDPYRRDPRPSSITESLWRGAQSRIPGARNFLPERRNVLGEMMKQTTRAVFDPTVGSEADHRRMLRELRKHDVGIGSPQRAPGETDEQLRVRARKTGQAVKIRLARVLQGNYFSVSRDQQEKRLKAAIAAARDDVPAPKPKVTAR